MSGSIISLINGQALLGVEAAEITQLQTVDVDRARDRVEHDAPSLTFARRGSKRLTAPR